MRAHVEFLQDLGGGFVLPLVHVDLGLLFEVRGVRRARLTLHLRVLGQLQLLEALKLRDPEEETNTRPKYYKKGSSRVARLYELLPGNRRLIRAR